MSSRKKILTIILSVVSALVLFAGAIAGTYAIFSEAKQDSINGEAGEVTINPITISTSNSNKLMPGDVIDFSWKVENAGNASVLTRNTVYLYWDYNDVSKQNASNGNDTVFVYKQTTSNSLIQSDILDMNPQSPNLIDIGSLTSFVVNGNTRSGYKFMTYGDTLDGVGTEAHTGVSTETNYGSTYDDNATTYDLVSFKLALSQMANINTSGQKLNIFVVTEAMQYENTDDSDWSLVGTASYTLN